MASPAVVVQPFGDFRVAGILAVFDTMPGVQFALLAAAIFACVVLPAVAVLRHAAVDGEPPELPRFSAEFPDGDQRGGTVRVHTEPAQQTALEHAAARLQGLQRMLYDLRRELHEDPDVPDVYCGRICEQIGKARRAVSNAQAHASIGANTYRTAAAKLRGDS